MADAIEWAHAEIWPDRPDVRTVVLLPPDTPKRWRREIMGMMPAPLAVQINDREWPDWIVLGRPSPEFPGDMDFHNALHKAWDKAEA